MARAAAIYPIAGLFGRSRSAIDGLTRAIMFRGGLREALAQGATVPVPSRGAPAGDRR